MATEQIAIERDGLGSSNYVSVYIICVYLSPELLVQSLSVLNLDDKGNVTKPLAHRAVFCFCVVLVKEELQISERYGLIVLREANRGKTLLVTAGRIVVKDLLRTKTSNKKV